MVAHCPCVYDTKNYAFINIIVFIAFNASVLIRGIVNVAADLGLYLVMNQFRHV
jgi:hypothetical protein